jgi:hypothetical protein
VETGHDGLGVDVLHQLNVEPTFAIGFSNVKF